MYPIYLYDNPNEPNGIEIVFPNEDWGCSPGIVKVTDSSILMHLRSHCYWYAMGVQKVSPAEYVVLRRLDPKPRGEREVVEIVKRVEAGKRSAQVKRELIAEMEGNSHVEATT